MDDCVVQCPFCNGERKAYTLVELSLDVWRESVCPLCGGEGVVTEDVEEQYLEDLELSELTDGY